MNSHNDTAFDMASSAAALWPHGGLGQLGDKMLFSLKPVFVGWALLLTQLPLQLLLTIWSALFFGGFASVARSWLSSGLEEGPDVTPGPFIFFGALTFTSVPLLFSSAGN